MTVSEIRKWASRGYGDSVVRRSILLLCLMGPAFAINFSLYYVAAALLSADNFGIFYISITTANVLYSGSFVLNIFFTRYLVSAAETTGVSAAYAARSRIQSLIIRWGALAALVSTLVLFGVGEWVGIRSQLIVVLVVLDAFTAYIIDIDRAFLQSLRKTIFLGSVTLSWMALRFVLAVAGMVVLGTPWGGMLGIVAASVLVLLALSRYFSSAKVVAPRSVALPSLKTLIPVTFGYISLIAVSNLDVMLAYLLLKDSSLGVYSASSVFPKGILILVTPLLQALYPLMIGYQKDHAHKLIIQKSAALVFLLSGLMAIGIFAFSGLLCGGKWGLKFCEPLPLQILLISAVALAVLRALVLYQSARGRDWMALSMLIPAVVYLGVAEASQRTVETVATQYAVFSAVLLFYFGGLTFFTEHRAFAAARFYGKS